MTLLSWLGFLVGIETYHTPRGRANLSALRQALASRVGLKRLSDGITRNVNKVHLGAASRLGLKLLTFANKSVFLEVVAPGLASRLGLKRRCLGFMATMRACCKRVGFPGGIETGLSNIEQCPQPALRQAWLPGWD